MDPDSFLIELTSALEQFRFSEVRSLTDRIDPTAFSLPQIRKTLSLIRRKRRFGDLEHAASLFIVAGKDEPVIKRSMGSVAPRSRPHLTGVDHPQIDDHEARRGPGGGTRDPGSDRSRL